MRKLAICFIALLALILSGCGPAKPKSTTNNVKPTTQKLLKSESKTWTFEQSVSSQLTRHGLIDKLTTSEPSKMSRDSSWTTSNGKFISNSLTYRQISLADWKAGTKKHYTKQTQKDIHYLTVPQVNAVLSKLGAKVTIQKLSDLVFIESENKPTVLNQAFVAQGHQLYAITVAYMDNRSPISIERGQSFSDTSTKPAANHVDVAKLNGVWIAADTETSAEDSGKLLVKDNYLYQHRYNSYERSAIEDLAKYPLITLNQSSTYSAQKR